MTRVFEQIICRRIDTRCGFIDFKIAAYKDKRQCKTMKELRIMPSTSIYAKGQLISAGSKTISVAEYLFSHYVPINYSD